MSTGFKYWGKLEEYYFSRTNAIAGYLVYGKYNTTDFYVAWRFTTSELVDFIPSKNLNKLKTEVERIKWYVSHHPYRDAFAGCHSESLCTLTSYRLVLYDIWSRPTGYGERRFLERRAVMRENILMTVDRDFRRDSSTVRSFCPTDQVASGRNKWSSLVFF